MEGKQVEEPRDNPNRSAEVVVVISDDDDLMIAETKEQNTDKMEILEKEQFAQEKEQVEQTGAAVDKRSEAASFIRTFSRETVDSSSTFGTRTSNMSGPSLSAILKLSHPKDATQACSLTPFCLYLYMGVELDAGQSTSVVLIGYLDPSSGVRVVRLLCTLQMSVDAADPQTSVDTDVDTDAAQADSHLLLDTLKTSNLSLSNLAVFYCNAPHPGLSRVFVAQLRAHSPGLVSLCGLPGIGGRACEAALSASFKYVVDLVGDIQHHCSTHPSVTDSLRELFAGGESYSTSQPVSAQCLVVIRTVRNMVGSWRELVKHFKSLRGTVQIDRIRTQLMDNKVELHFLFLSQSLEPLGSIEEVQQRGEADVEAELQLTSALIQFYAETIFCPSSAKRFVRRPDLHLLHSERELLPSSDMNFGSNAMDYLWATAHVDLGEQERSDFLKAAVTFYKAVLQSIVLSAPQQLGRVTLRDIDTVLKHPENINVRRLISFVSSSSECEPAPVRCHTSLVWFRPSDFSVSSKRSGVKGSSDQLVWIWNTFENMYFCVYILFSFFNSGSIYLAVFVFCFIYDKVYSLTVKTSITFLCHQGLIITSDMLWCRCSLSRILSCPDLWCPSWGFSWVCVKSGLQRRISWHSTSSGSLRPGRRNRRAEQEVLTGPR